MKKECGVWLCAALSCIALISCDTNETGMAGNADLKMLATSAPAPTSADAGKMAPRDSVVFSEFLVGISEIKLLAHKEHDDWNHDCEKDSVESEDDNDAESKSEDFTITGPFTVDLVAGTSSPDFGTLQIPPGSYAAIKVKLSPVLADGNTLTLRADGFSPNGDEYSIDLTRKFTAEFKIRKHIEIDSTGTNSLLVLMHTKALFGGVDFGQASSGPGGMISLTHESNRALVEKILVNLRNALRAGKDQNHDNKIDE